MFEYRSLVTVTNTDLHNVGNDPFSNVELMHIFFQKIFHRLLHGIDGDIFHVHELLCCDDKKKLYLNFRSQSEQK